jgi:FeS assembly SUF system regulator
MSQIAKSRANELHTARDLASRCQLPLPTVSKLLKVLLHHGLLASHRGTKGGYSLARDPHLISVGEIIVAMEGPLALTECSLESGSLCDLEASCAIRDNQRIINQVVRGALEGVMLSDLIRPMQLIAIRDAKGNVVTTTSTASGRMQ